MNYSAGFARIMNIVNILTGIVAFALVVILQFSPMDTVKVLGPLAFTPLLSIGFIRQWLRDRGASALRINALTFIGIVTAGVVGSWVSFLPRVTLAQMPEVIFYTMILAIALSPVIIAGTIFKLFGGLGKAAGYVADGFKQEK